MNSQKSQGYHLPSITPSINDTKTFITWLSRCDFSWGFMYADLISKESTLLVVFGHGRL